MGSIGSTESAGYHCPQCDYDLRGLTESRCPECGRPFSTQEIAAYKERRWPPQKLFRALILATIPWCIAYIFVDAIHGTPDRANAGWATYPFLLVPLQLVLAMVAAGALEASSKRAMKRFGAVLTVIVWFLILGHIAITIATL